MTRHRPAFSGKRITLLDWQLKDLERMLGRHAGEFDLFAFLTETDDALEDSGDVVPPLHQQHRWLQALLFEEVQRRGLPIAKTIRRSNGSWSLAICPHSPKCGSAWRCHQLQQIALHKAES